MEFAVKVLTLDAALPAELAKLEADGWQLVVGVKPLAMYFVGRAAQGLGAQGGFSIDETKVEVIRAKRE